MPRASWVLILLAGLSAAIVSQECQAQSFSFSIGSYPGGHCHHHHHPCWGSSYWFGPPRVDYVYVVPPPRPRVTYIQPAPADPYAGRVETNYSAASLTPAASKSAASTPVSTVAAGESLQIWNSAGQRVPVAFLVNSQNVSLFDGQSHTFYGGGTRTIEFDRGGSFGPARYELTTGQYEFTLTSHGWDLAPRSDRTAPIALRPIVPKNTLPADTTAR